MKASRIVDHPRYGARGRGALLRARRIGIRGRGARSGRRASQQARCAQGAVRGIAQVTGGASGVANIPGNFSGRGALFARRYNCTGRAILVRRLGIGIFEVRFVGNAAPTVIAAGLGGANPVCRARRAEHVQGQRVPCRHLGSRRSPVRGGARLTVPAGDASAAAAKRTPLGVLRDRSPRERIPVLRQADQGSRGETNTASVPAMRSSAAASAMKRKVTSLSPGSWPSFELSLE